MKGKDCKVCGVEIITYNKHRNRCYECKPKGVPKIVFDKHHPTTGIPLYKKVWAWLTEPKKNKEAK